MVSIISRGRIPPPGISRYFFVPGASFAATALDGVYFIFLQKIICDCLCLVRYANTFDLEELSDDDEQRMYFLPSISYSKLVFVVFPPKRRVVSSSNIKINWPKTFLLFAPTQSSPQSERHLYTSLQHQQQLILPLHPPSFTLRLDRLPPPITHKSTNFLKRKRRTSWRSRCLEDPPNSRKTGWCIIHVCMCA